MRRLLGVFIAAFILCIAPSSADTNADLTRIVRTIIAAAPQNFESLANPPPKNFGPWGGVRKDVGSPLFDFCGVEARRLQAIMGCIRLLRKTGEPLYPSRRGFVAAMTKAIGSTFREIDCSSYRPIGARILNLDYISCYQNAAGASFAACCNSVRQQRGGL